MKELRREDLHPNPINQFSAWFDVAEEAPDLHYPNAFCLSTLDADGYPNARIVLLKEFGERGFAFFTNTRSIKGQALNKHPRAAMTFYWDALRRQVRIQGDVTQVTAAESDSYFATRPRESQIGAWASEQSAPLGNRSELEQRLETWRAQFGKGPVPRPDYWCGYLLNPKRFEFWQERDFRLHDRFLYSRSGSGEWSISSLQP